MKKLFQDLQPWILQILNTIRKDLRTEMLGSDREFYRTYFGNRPQNRLTAEEIFAAYEKELLKGNQDLGEWVVNRWVFKHGDLYTHFAERLGRIASDFSEIQTLDMSQSEEILKGAPDSFGAVPVYLFSMLNGVVFPQEILERLRIAAEKEAATKQEEQVAAQEKESLEQLAQRHQRELSRLNEKYESKLAGVQKKYTTDIEALKKQIRALQQKLNAKQP